MKCQILISILLLASLRSLAQDSLLSEANHHPQLSFGSDLLPTYPITNEILIVSPFGFGFQTRKDFGRWTRNFTFMTFVSPYSTSGLQRVVRGWDDKTINFTDYQISSNETEIRGGIGRHVDLGIWHLNTYIGLSEIQYRFYNNQSNYERDPATGRILYLDPNTGNSAPYPTSEMLRGDTSDYFNQRTKQYIRFGLSPGYQIVFRVGRVVASVNAFYDIGWRIHLSSAGNDPIGISNDLREGFHQELKMFVTLGYKQKRFTLFKGQK